MIADEGKITSLRIEELGLDFGSLRALDSVTFEVREGEIVSIVGPNGAGKTCVVNCINGFYKPTHGRIYFNGRDIVGLPPYTIAQLGIGRTFQNIELYTGLSTLDNIMAGRHFKTRYGWLSAALYFGKAQREEVKQRMLAEEIIDFLEIQHIRDQPVGLLPYGLRKRVELGRALALDPDLLVLDEPMAGMNVEEKEDMARFVLDMNTEKGTPILLIEHDMGVVMDIADKVVVLDWGRKIAEGSPEIIKCNQEVVKAFLGEE